MSRARRALLRSLQRWERPRDSRVIGGVCAAIAEALGIHPLLLRLAFVVLALANGLGALLYLVLWVLLPDEGERLDRGSLGSALRGRLEKVVGEAGTSRRNVAQALSAGRRGSPWPRPLDRWWLGAGLVAAGLRVVLVSFGWFDWITPTRALGLVAVAIGLGLVLSAGQGQAR